MCFCNINFLRDFAIYYTFVGLKRLLLISLLTVYVFSITEFHQFVKLPFLIEHYFEHKEKNLNLSLLEFLNMHYSKDEAKKADIDSDMRLPFKSHDDCMSTLSIAFVPNQIEELSQKPEFIETNTYSVDTDLFLPSAYLSAIWQPPKAC